jgi:hypothetical protein
MLVGILIIASWDFLNSPSCRGYFIMVAPGVDHWLLLLLVVDRIMEILFFYHPRTVIESWRVFMVNKRDSWL